MAQAAESACALGFVRPCGRSACVCACVREGVRVCVRTERRGNALSLGRPCPHVCVCAELLTGAELRQPGGRQGRHEPHALGSTGPGDLGLRAIRVPLRISAFLPPHALAHLPLCDPALRSRSLCFRVAARAL
jgi:hypothetical protein